MNNQHIPASAAGDIAHMVGSAVKSESHRARIKIIGEIGWLKGVEPNLTAIGAVGECSRPRDSLPGRLNRWPFSIGPVRRIAVAAWNFMTREWRALADKTFNALRLLHNRVVKLEDAEQNRVEVIAIAERVAEIEARLRQRDNRREGAYLDDAAITRFMEAVARRFRGDPAANKANLAVHLDAVRSAVAAVPGKPALDLGCGHGEWLALMGEAGIAAYGVDLSPECIAACHKLGIDADYGDALQALDDAAPGRVGVVTAFHLIEHLPLAAQIALFTKAYTALAPGGLLLLETPNAENLFSISNSFWYDPTHQRPVPANLLSVFAEVAGFSRIEVRNIHPPAIPPLEVDHYPPRLRHMLFCGQDTALYAFK